MKEALKHLPGSWKNPLSGRITTVVNEKIFKAYEELFKWAQTYKIGLEPFKHSYGSLVELDGEFWTDFKISENYDLTEKFFGDGITAVKGKVRPAGFTPCQHCYIRGLKVHEVTRLNGHITYLCSVCAGNCVKCNAIIYSAEYPPELEALCAKCRPVFKCAICTVTKSKESGIETIDLYSKHDVIYREKATVCPACEKKSKCGVCERYFVRGTKFVDYEGVNCCPICHKEKVAKDFEKYEKFQLTELPKGGLSIKALPARPVRTISIETEMDGDKFALAETLFRCGLVRVPEVERYGTQTPDESAWPAFLKHDGSVSGGELISFMLDFSKKEHTEVLKTTLRKLRALEKTRSIEFNPNCGGHIHIDAHGFGTENVWRLLTIWNYLEDFTYRFAGAGSPYGHRTLVAGHDRANGGLGYANPTVKGPWGVKSSVGQAVRQQNRMCGLNFQPYLGAIRYCECGALTKDDMRACKCPLPKCTIEWRVWNSQRNPRIIHAWIAFMQSVHALADVEGDPDAEFEKRFPTFAWTKLPFKGLTDSHKKALYERIEWCFGNLVMSPEERDSFLYTIKETDIDITPSFERQLLSITPPSTTRPIVRAVRETRFNKRKSIVIQPPKPEQLKKTTTASERLLQQQYNRLVPRPVARRRRLWN